MPRTRTTVVPVVLGAALLLTACGGGGSESVAAASSERPSPSSSSAAATTGAAPEVTAWEYDVAVLRDPVAVDTALLVVHSADGATAPGADPAVTAVEATTGEALWTTELPVPQGGSAQHDSDPAAVLVGSAGREPALLVQYTVIVPASGLSAGGTTDRVAALAVDDGDLLWEADAPGNLLPADDTLLAADGRSEQTRALFTTGGEDATVTALDVATGAPVWQRPGIAGVWGATGGTLVTEVVTGTNTDLLGLDVLTGAQRWLTTAATVPGIRDMWDWDAGAVGSGRVLGETDTLGIEGHRTAGVLLDAVTGQTLAVVGDETWTSTANADAHVIAPDGATAYLLYEGEFLYGLRAGEAGWEVALPNTSYPGQAILDVTDDTVVLRSAGLVTLDAATGEQVGPVAEEEPVDEELWGTVAGWEIRRTYPGLTGTLVED
ncbi:outer membrane protein assembly factor BamB family protein [Blastococcus sp. SYSU D00820]